MSEERHFSHSSMSTWRRCRVRYKWSYVDNYASPASIGQVRGLGGHQGLAEWYRSFDVDKSLSKAYEPFAEREISTGESLMGEWDLLELILRRYFEWSKDNDDFEEIVSLEQKFEFQLKGHTVIGYIDGVVKVGESLWLLENKFNKRVSMNHIDLDPQISLYLLACYKLGIDVRGVYFNVIRVAEGGIAAKQPVVRAKVHRNQEGLEFISAETAIQLEEMSKFHKNGGGAIYRNPTRDCSWDCGFYRACQAINDDGNVKLALSVFPIVPREENLKGDSSDE